MSLWTELNDFSFYNKRIPCPICKGNAEPTLVGNHWKCGCAHIFNENGSDIEVDCYCDVCIKKQEPKVLKDLKKKIGKKKKK